MLYRLLLSSSALLSVVFVSTAMPVKEGNALVAKSVFAMDRDGGREEEGPELEDIVSKDCAACLEMASRDEEPSSCAEATGYLTTCGKPPPRWRGAPPEVAWCSPKDVEKVMEAFGEKLGCAPMPSPSPAP